MRFHKILIQAIVQLLHKIVDEGVYADKAVEQLLKSNSKWGSRDRKFVAENIYQMIRWWRLLTEIESRTTSTSKNDYYVLFGIWQLLKDIELPEWEEFASIDKTKILDTTYQVKQVRKFREAIPDWLDTLGENELGAEVWEHEISELNKEAEVVIRANTLKTTTDSLQNKLATQQIATKFLHTSYPLFAGDSSNALIVPRQHLFNLNEYKQGLFEVQDAASQLIAPFMQLSEGMTVIDACAGAGGKSLHIAAMLKNKGKITAMDVEERKLSELKKRAERAGANCIRTQVISNTSLAAHKNTADRLLLDVPCSGLGVLRRNPDAKWKLNIEFINQVRKTQQDILTRYSEMVKPGGFIVYATCSILPSENQLQIKQFIEQHTNYQFINERKVLPSEGFDGFYMALIKRVN